MIGASKSGFSLTTRLLSLTTSFLILAILAGCGGSSGGGGGFGVGGTPITGMVGTGTPSFPVPGGGGGLPAAPAAGIPSATIEALDADGNVVASTTSDASGNYTITVPDGTFDIGIRVGTVSEFIPLRSSVIVNGSTVDGAPAVGGSATLDFVVPQAAGSTLTGTVTDVNTANPINNAIVEFVDSESGLVRYRTSTDASGNYTANVLPAGSFLVRLDPATVPTGLVAPSPKTVSVTSGGISPATLDFAAVTATSVGGALTTAVGVAPIAAVGPEGVLVPASILEVPVTIEVGAQVIVEEAGIGEVARFPLATDGSYDLDLRDGSYILTFVGFASDTVAPAPQRITVKNGLIYTEDSDTPLDPLTDSLASAASDVSATLAGTVLRNGNGVQTRVLAIDPATGGVLADADTNSAGAFTMPLSDGSYDIILTNRLPSGVIPPNPIRVAVEAGADPAVPIKENSGTANNGSIAFNLKSASVVLTGDVLDSSNPLIAFPDVRVVARKGEKIVARAVSDADGAYTLNLPVGTIDISLVKSSVPAGFLPVKPIRLEVAVAGGVGTITDSAGTLTTLDYLLVARAPNVTGTVVYDFDGSTAIDPGEEVGCRVIVTEPGKTKVLLDTATDPTDGSYSLVLPNGTYNIGLDSKSLPPGTAAPAPTRVSVTATAVTLSDGTSAASATVDMELLARAATLQGVVTLTGRGVPVELLLLDASSGRIVSRTSALPLSGAYRMPVYQGSYVLKINSSTLPAGTASPGAVNLSVAANGTINTDTASAVPAVNFVLTRVVVELTGTVTVTRGVDIFPVEAFVQVRSPQDHSVLFETLSDPETGDYSLVLLAGSYEIAVDSSTLPPGVIRPAPVLITVTNTITGTGVVSNALDLALNDTRTAGVTISGYIFDGGGTNDPAPAELRVYDPFEGNPIDNFLYLVNADENGFYSFVALDGTFAMAILPESLPSTAIAPAAVNFSVQGNTIVENNVLDDPAANGNAANDGTINLSFQDAANQGITVRGVVQDPGANNLPFVFVIARNASTGEIVAESFTNPNTGLYSMLLPLGSYTLEVDPFSLPFDPTNVANNLLAPAPKSVLAIDNGGIVVSSGSGAVITPDGGGNYVFDFFPIAASQSVTGTVVDSSANPVGVFVKVLDSSGNQVRLRFADGGNFAFQLPPGAYTVRVVASSVPFGQIAPAPVAVTVTSSGVLESNGTADDGVLAFTLLSGAQTVSGTVLDSSSLPIGCFVLAIDALTGEFVGGSPTNPVTGAYTFTLPVGSYMLGIEPGSLPVGYLSPPPITIQVTSGTNITGQDFTVTIATASITGDVRNVSGIVIPALVVLFDASTNNFVTAVPSDPSNGTYSLSAPPGAYIVKLLPESLPEGSIAPPAVAVQITAGGTFLEANTAGIGNLVDDGIVNFRIAEPAALETLTGNVTLSTPGGTFPLGVEVLVENASDDSFVNSDFSDPGSGGAYSINLESGTYRVRINQNALPPGVSAPSPIVITVNTVGGTITQTVGGLPVISSVLDFDLELSLNDIDGTVTLVDGVGAPVSGFPCVIRVLDPNDGFILHTQPTDPNGDFTLSGPDGTYLIAISPNSLPAGFIPSPAVTITMSSGLVTESSGTANDGLLEFTVSNTSTTLTGSVVDTSANDLFCFMNVIDTNTGIVVFGAPSNGANGFALELLDGTYDIAVAPPSLPQNAVPPNPTRILVDSTATPAITVVSAGSGVLTGSDLAVTVTLANIATSFDVEIEDNSANPLAGLVRIRDSGGNIVQNVNVPTSGTATVTLGDGNYTVAVVASSVPPGLTVPAAVGITVGGGAVTYTSGGAPADPTTIVCTATQLIGTIYDAVDTVPATDVTLVDLQLLNGAGVVLNTVPLVQSGTDATYSTNLSTGTYKLRVVRAAGVTENDVLLPAPITVTVQNGVIQNPDDDPLTPDVDVDIFIPTIAATASGAITLDASAVGAGLQVTARNPSNGNIINSTVTDGSGNYSLAVPAGVVDLGVNPSSLSNLYPTALQPLPYPLSISAGGTITELDAGTPGNALDFAMVSFNALADAEIIGTISARQNSVATPTVVEAANVILLSQNGEFLASTFTDVNGEFSLFPPDGVGFLVVDPASINVTYPILPPIPVTISTLGTTVVEGNTLGVDPTDGVTPNAADDGIVNFIMEGASVLLTGRVQNEAGAGVGAGLVVTPASATAIPTLAYTQFTAPDGVFAIPVGTGAFKLWVDPNTVPEGFITPGPISFTVSGGNISETNTAGTNNVANDGVVNPILENGGALVFGRLLDSSGSPLPGFVGLFEESGNPGVPPFFIAGVGVDPLTGDFAIPIGNGSFFLEVDPFSLPPSELSPDRVFFSVDGVTVTFSATTTTATDIFGTETGAVLQTAFASTALRGTVTNSSTNGVSAFVEVIDSTTGAFVHEAFCDPTTGRYDLTLGDGTFILKVNPFSLPPGAIAPSPVTFSINGATVNEANTAGVDPDDGITANAANDGIINFVLSDAGATLTGIVEDISGNPASAFVAVFAQNSAGEFENFVTGTSSDFLDGSFTFPLTDGTYQVGVDPGSLPPGVGAPDRVTVTVAGALITYSANAELSGADLVFQLAPLTGGVQGTVSDASMNPIQAFIIVEKAATGEFVAAAGTGTQGGYSISLAAGNYRVFIDPPSLPQGVLAPSPATITVASTFVTKNFTVSTAAVNIQGHVLSLVNPIDPATIDCSLITTNADLDPIGCYVILVSPSPDPNQPPNFVAETFANPTTGFFSLPVGNGSYDLIIDPVSLPAGMLAPPPLSVTVTNGVLSTSGDFELCFDGANAARRLLFVEQSTVTLVGELVDLSANPVPGFVMLRNASDGSFITGTPTDPATGGFSIPLGDLTYELEVDPQSVPLGFIAPPAVSVTAAGGTIVVGNVNGVTYDSGATPPMTITVQSASSAVSGTVTDAAGAGMQVQVVALDSSDNYIASTFSSPSGNYTIPIAPGTYEIKIDPFSIPPGFSPPASSLVTLSGGQTIIVDFELASTTSTVSGKVFYNDTGSGSEVAIGAFIELRDAVTNDFLGGMYSEPNALQELVYSLPIGAGSFEVRVDPFSVPPGLLAPPPVAFTVTVNSISGAVTISEDAHGGDPDLTDGVIDFELSEAGNQFFGQIRADFGGGLTGTFGVVFLEIADGSQTIIAEAVSTPNGKFDFYLADGSYNMFVDPFSLPNGFISPPPVFVTVSGGTVSVDGTPTATDANTRYNLDLGIAAASLTGLVLDDSANPLPGVFVIQFNAATGSYLNDSFTDPSGRYLLPVVDGNFRVEVDPYSLPAGLIPPPPTDINVSGTTVTLSNNSTLDLTIPDDLDLICAAPVGSVQVEVVDEFGNPQYAEVEVTNASGSVVIANVFVSGAPQTIGLAAGAYLVRIPSFSLPPGLIAPGPVSLTVAGNGDTTDGSGNSTDGQITFTLSEAAAIISGTVSLAGSPIAGAQLAAMSGGNQVATANTNINGFYSIELSVGNYELAFIGGLPSGVVPPAPTFISVSDQDMTVDFDLIPADGDVTGTITLDGAGVEAIVQAITFDPVSGGFAPVTSTITDANGDYQLFLPNGTFTIIAEFEDTVVDPALDILVPPIPVESIVNNDSTILDLAYFIQGNGAPGEPTTQTLIGDITAGGAPFDVPLIVFHLSGTSPVEVPVGLFRSNGGSSQIALIEDATDYRVAIFEPELPPNGFTAPAPVDVTVNTGTITGTGVTPDGANFRLDWDIAVTGAVIFGTVTDALGAPLIGVEVGSFDTFNFTPGPLNFTDQSGSYSLVLPVGEWAVGLHALPANVVAPAEQEVVIAGTGPYTIDIDGVTAPDGNIDWVVADAHAVLTGQVFIDNGGGPFPAPGRIIALDGTTEVSSVVTQNGSYEIFLPLGTLTVVAELDFFDPFVILPLPFETTVTDTGAVVALTHDFEFVSPDATNPGQMVSGRVMSDGVALEVDLDIFTAAGVFVGTIHSDFDGFWSVILAPGDYTLSVATEDLPIGFTGTSTVGFTVTADGVDGNGVQFGNVFFSLNTVGNAVSGSVTDSTGAAVAGAALFFFSDSDDSVSLAVTDGSGDYTITLPDDFYEVEFDATSAPSGHVVPAITDIQVAGAPLTLDFALVASDGTVAGSLADSVGPVAGWIYAYDPVTLAEVTFTTTDASGDYSLELPAGDYVLVPELNDFGGGTGGPGTPPPMPTVQPDPIFASISAGTALTGQDFFFADLAAAGAFSISGNLVFGQGNPAINGEIAVFKDIGGQWLIFNFYDSGSFGSPEGEGFFFDLTPGTYRLEVVEVQGSAASAGPRELIVDGSGITEGGQPASFLQIDVNVLAVTGTVTLTGVGVVEGVEVAAFQSGPSGNMLIGAGTTDASGNYTLNLPEGSYELRLTTGVPAEGIAPPAVFADVADNAGTLELTIESSLVTPPIVDWTLTAAHGNLNGTVTVDGTLFDAEIDVYEGTTLIMTAPAPLGAFDFNVPDGDFSVIARVPGISPEILPPLPLAVTVVDTGSIESTNHDFLFVTPAPGSTQTLTGLVLTDGNPIPNATLFLQTTAGALITPVYGDISGSFAVALAAGDYRLVVDPADVPAGFPGVAETAFTVDANGISGGGVQFNHLDFDLDTLGTSVTGTVTDYTGAAVANVILYFELEPLTGPPVVRFAVTDGSGGYALYLQDDFWEIFFDPSSIPNGLVVPGYSDANVAGTPAVFDFVLEEAVGSVSGHAFIEGAPPLFGEVIITDPSDGSEVTFTDVDASGLYTIPMPAGSYVVFAEVGDFDPATTLIPDPVEITITAGQNLTVDFDWDLAGATPHQVLTVQVLDQGATAQAEIDFLKESATTADLFLEYAIEVSTQFDGVDESLDIALTPGTYEVLVDSVYGQFVSVAAVEIVVSASDISVAGTPLTNNLLQINASPTGPPPTGYLVTGVVRDSAGAVASGIFIEARDLSTGSPMATANTDLGGNYSLDLPIGSYEVFIDGALPANDLPPAAVLVDVTDNAGTLEASFDGVPTLDGILDFDLLAGHGSLDGTIIVDGVVTDGSILIFEGLTQISETFTVSGAFDILLPAGTFNAIAVVPGIDNINLLTPLPFSLTVVDTGSVEVTTHDFDFVQLAANPGATLFGKYLVDGFGMTGSMTITLSTGEMVARTFSDGSGDFAITLPPEDYLISIDNDSLPLTYSNETSTDFSIVGNTISGPGILDQNLWFVVNTLGTVVSGSVTDHLGAAIADAVIHFEWFDPAAGDRSAWAITDVAGDYTILLEEQFYESFFDVATIPSTSVRPAFADFALDMNPLTLDFSLLEAVGTVSGTVTLNGTPNGDEELFVNDPSTLDEISFVEVAVDGTYTINMPAGDWTIMPEGEFDLTTIVTPDPSRQTVTIGSAATGVDFDFITATTEQVLTGRLLSNAIPNFGDVFITKEDAGVPGQYDAFAWVDAEFDGADFFFNIALTAGTYQLYALGYNDFDINVGPFDVVVTPSDITVDGVLLTGNLDIDVGANPGAPSFQVTGTITDGLGAAVAGVVIEAISLTGPGSIQSTTSDVAGAYTLDLVEGEYELAVLSGAPVDHVTPLPVDAQVLDNAGTLELEVEGVANPTGVVDWSFTTAHGNVTGTVAVDTIATDAEIAVFDGTTLVALGDAPGGVFDVDLPEGSLTVIAIVEDLQSGILVPAPYQVTVVDTGSVETTNHDFDFVTIDGLNPGQTLTGTITADGFAVPYVSLFILDGSGVVVMVIETDEFGEFEVSLPPGNYTIEIEAAQIPPGAVGVTSTTFIVTNDAVDGQGFLQGSISFGIATTGSTLSGTVTDSGGAAVAAQVLFVEGRGAPGGTGGDFEAFAVTDVLGAYSLDLPDGDYEVFFDATRVPAGEVMPGITEVTIAGAPVTQDIQFLAADAAVSGTVTIAGAATNLGFVAAYDTTTNDPVNYGLTDVNGDYSIELPAGTFTIQTWIDEDFIDLSAYLIPDPARVTISGGVPVTGTDFDFADATATSHQAINGHLVDTLVFVSGGFDLFKESAATPGQFDFFGEFETEWNGAEEAFSMWLTEGTYTLEITEANGAPFTFGPFTLVVTAGGVTFDGQSVTGDLDIDINPAPPLFNVTELNGTAVFAGAPVSGLDVVLDPLDSAGSPLTATTDVDGNYLFASAPDGEYWLTVGPTGMPVGATVPRLTKVTVAASEFTPPIAHIGFPAAAGTLSGTVSIDTVGAVGQVLIFDQTPSLIAQVDTDGSGVYSIDLPEGTFTAMAVLDAGAGTEVPPITPAFTFTTSATQDFDFSTSASSEMLTGVVSFGGATLGDLPILIYQDGNPPLPVAIGSSDPVDGSYSARVPYGTFDVILSPQHVPAGELVGEPITIVVDGTGINGTDLDGNAIATNTLDLDPYNTGDPGDVRQVVADLMAAVMDGNATALDVVLHSTALWSGEDETTILANWPLEENWGNQIFQGFVGIVTNVDANNWICDLQFGQELAVGLNGSMEEYRFDSRVTGDTSLRLAITRDSGIDPWEIVGNERYFSEAELGNRIGEIFDGSSTFTENVYLTVEETDGVDLTSVSVAGTGITDGTLTESAPPQDGEWLAFIDTSSSGPPPFSAAFGSLAGDYTFTINSAGGTDTEILTLATPVASLYPTITVSVLPDGSALVEWEDISNQLGAAIQEVVLSVEADDGVGGFFPIFEAEQLPVGLNWVNVPNTIFTNGQPFNFVVEYFDVGVALHTYTLEVTSWPTLP